MEGIASVDWFKRWQKFRNFAQGLTFNIMVAHANEQLKNERPLFADSW